MTLDKCVQRLRKRLSDENTLSSDGLRKASLVSMSGLSVSDPSLHSEMCKVTSLSDLKVTDSSNTCPIKRRSSVGGAIAQRFQEVSSSRRESISGVGLTLSTSTQDFESLYTLNGNQSEESEADGIHKYALHYIIE